MWISPPSCLYCLNEHPPDLGCRSLCVNRSGRHNYRHKLDQVVRGYITGTPKCTTPRWESTPAADNSFRWDLLKAHSHQYSSAGFPKTAALRMLDGRCLDPTYLEGYCAGEGIATSTTSPTFSSPLLLAWNKIVLQVFHRSGLSVEAPKQLRIPQMPPFSLKGGRGVCCSPSEF